MRTMTGFLNKLSLSFVFIAVILSSSFSIRSSICGEIRNNKALDEKVETFLESREGAWHDWNIPYSDGKILYDLVLKNNYSERDVVSTLIDSEFEFYLYRFGGCSQFQVNRGRGCKYKE